MRYAQINSKYVCGIDLHAREMYACVMNEKGEILFHRNMRTDFDQFKKKMISFLPDLSVGVESTHMYYWLADACREENIPFYLGHAYYMKTIHGGKTKTDRLDCCKIADLMRTNYYPLAYAYPKEMRGTRDLLRRRHRFSRLRAECYHHIQSLFHQQGISVNPKDVKNAKSRRDLVQSHLDKDIYSNAQTDLDMIDFLDPVIKQSEQQIRAQAKCHDRASLNILMSVPGIGDIFSLIILYEIHDINCFQSHSISVLTLGWSNVNVLLPENTPKAAIRKSDGLYTICLKINPDLLGSHTSNSGQLWTNPFAIIPKLNGARSTITIYEAMIMDRS